VRRVLQISLVALAVGSGCGGDPTVPPPAARVPGPHEVRAGDDGSVVKPLPAQVRVEMPVPTESTPPPAAPGEMASETSRFVNAYNRVGKPRILVWVAHEPGGIRDEAAAGGIDFSAIQTMLTDWFACGGSVAVVSREAARATLGAEPIRNLDAGQNINTKELNDRIHADILIIVRAQPTRAGSDGVGVRLDADASNLVGGESVGRAVLEIPPPLDKPQLSTYTHFLAKKLMNDMTGSWTSFGTVGSPAGPSR
jgi:hypothetical protein